VETERLRYFVLAYDSRARRVLTAASVPDLLAHHAELFAGLALPEE
jgi:hypothetical protein